MSDSNFSRVYPPAQRQLLDGGLNNKFEKSIIEGNESPDCLNVVFSNGKVSTRGGTSKLNTTSVGSFVCDGIYTRHNNANAETMTVWFNGTHYTLGTTTFTTTPSGQSVFTAGIRVASAQYENHIFYGNGGSIPYKYNGTDFTRHGVYEPTTTSTVASQATGSLTGPYSYKVTFVNSQSVESDVGPVSNTFTAASATLRLTSIPVAAQSWGINARRIYRTETAGSTYLRLTTLNDNTTTQYDDNNLDATLGVEAPTDNGVPPLYNACVYHSNRLFMNDPANPNFVWYSELANPYTVASTNFIRAGDNTSDIVKGFGVYENHLYVYCENSVWLIYMNSTDPDEWTLLKTKSAYGSKSPFGMFNFGYKQMFPAVQNDKFVGFVALQGVNVDPTVSVLSGGAAGSEISSDKIEPSIFDVSESMVGNISSLVYKNQAWIAVTSGSGNLTNNKIFLFDFSISNVAKDQKFSWAPFDGIAPAQFAVYGGNIYYGSATANGFVYQADTSTYADSGVAIDSYFWTKEFSGLDTDFNLQKDFRYLNILVDKLGDYSMDINYKVDSDIGDGNLVTLSLNPGGSLWGTMEWGTDSWGGGTEQSEHRLYLANARGKRIQFKFSNQETINQGFGVHGLNFRYNIKGYR